MESNRCSAHARNGRLSGDAAPALLRITTLSLFGTSDRGIGLIEIHDTGRRWRWILLDDGGEVLREGHEPCQPEAVRVAEAAAGLTDRPADD